MPAQLIDLSDDQLEFVLNTLQKHLDKSAKAWIFGSRAKWTAKKFSDLDMAIDAGQTLSFTKLNALNDAFIKSDFPYKVDIVDLTDVNESFKQTIMSQAVELPWQSTANAKCSKRP